MVKRISGLFPQIVDMSNLRQGCRKAAQGRMHLRDVAQYVADQDTQLEDLRRRLLDHTYVPGPYRIFEIHEHGKDRVIHAAQNFEDRVLQHAIVQIVEQPVYFRLFTDFTHAAIPGHGVHSAMRQVSKQISWHPNETKYCLSLDVKKYFAHINHQILKDQHRRVIKDPDLLWLLDSIIDSTTGVGIPIGNYLSQYFANFYLSWFDHWMRETLHISFACRYMDNVIILAGNTDQLRRWHREIEWYLQSNLQLEIKDDWQIYPIAARGIDFVGYRIFPDGRVLMRKSIWLACQRACRQAQKHQKIYGRLTQRERGQVAAYYGWMLHCDPISRMTIYDKCFRPLEDGKQITFRLLR